MNPRQWVIRFTGLGVALCAAAPAQDSPDALRLAKLLSELEGHRFHEAMEELTAAGAAAVPHLVKYVRESNEDTSRIRAVRVLGRIGEAATAAVPDLLDLTSSPTLRASVVVALGRIGPYDPQVGPDIRSNMVAHMAGVPTDRRGGVVFVSDSATAETYSRTLLDPRDSTAHISAALQDENPYVRAFAAEILFTRGDADDSIIAALHRAVTDPHPKEFVCGAAEGFTVQEEVDLDRRIHRLAARALVHIAAEDPRSLPGHRIMLAAVDPEDRLEATMALGHLGNTAAPAVPQLLRLLEGDLPAIQREAVTTLGMIGPDAGSAIPALERLAAGPDRQLAERASSALRQIRRSDPGVEHELRSDPPGFERRADDPGEATARRAKRDPSISRARPTGSCAS